MRSQRLREEVDRVIYGLPTRPDQDSFYDLVDTSSWFKRRKWKRAAEKVSSFAAHWPSEANSILAFSADCMIGSGDLQGAIAQIPRPIIGARATEVANRILSLKAAVGQDMGAEEILLLFGPKLTKFGRENLVEIQAYIDVHLDFQRAESSVSLLERWKPNARKSPHGMSLFAGHQSYILTKKCEYYSFHLSPVIEEECASLFRDAENAYREDQSLPRVGEGWVSETRLFYEIKNAFPGEKVLQHASPEWLGRQHLDIFIPSLSLAIEYQGRQHLEPVTFFGGEEAFKKTIERDRKKMRRCKSNDVTLLYVYENYDLQQVINEINSGIDK